MPKHSKISNPNAVGSQTLISQLLGISRGKFQRLEEKGVFERINYDGVHPLYSVRDCFQAFVEQSVNEVRGDNGEVLDHLAEKALLDKERRKQLEIANAKTLGELRDASEVRDVFAEALKVLVRALSTLPDRLERECQLDVKQVVLVETVINSARAAMVRRLGSGDQSNAKQASLHA